MADEWVCVDCGHSTPVDPGTEGCPECGSKMEKIDDLDNDLSKNESYKDEELKTPLDDDIELPDVDDGVEEDEEDEDDTGEDIPDIGSKNRNDDEAMSTLSEENDSDTKSKEEREVREEE
jgi:hypothetical protein